MAEILYVPAAITVIAFFICYRFTKPIFIMSEDRALKIALKPKSSDYRLKLENAYNSLVDRIRIYDETSERMQQIIVEARYSLH